ncbi:hypothetical protein I317_06146 [Kwoniella heveanensis CBS 569]|nr:hypothetical protein I317_06146 [Kwoniella heveanensis CBS 569]
MASAKTSPSDPLSALGASLFLQVLSDLPLQSLLTCTRVCRSWKSCIDFSTATLYRPLAHSLGVESKRLKALEEQERAFARPSSWNNISAGSDPEEPQLEPGSEPESEPDEESGIGGSSGGLEGSVDWKGVVKAWVVLQGNWKQASAKGSWITPGRNTVWRLKVDKEEDTIITTSRLDGILVADAETNEPLFEYTDVAPYAHLEFAKGFVIFNIGNEHVHEVHVTPSAYARLSPSKRAALPPFNRSLTHGTAYSFASSDHYHPPRPAADNSPPPRGHLTYYRTIRPPTECFAFRARVDRADTDDERAVLGTAGAQGAYIFDLEDESKVERYTFTEPETRRPNVSYIEFDDDYLFICGNTQVHIHSRLTRRKILSFPPSSPSGQASAIYNTNFEDLWRTFPGRTPRGTVPTRRADIPGEWRGDARFPSYTQSIVVREFTACHFTSTDLFATTMTGCLYVLRNYKEVLAIEDQSKRENATRENTLVVVFRQPLKQLSTFGEHVVFSDLVVCGHLESRITSMRLAVRSPNQLFLSEICAGLHEVDREKVYATYWALGEHQAGGVRNEITGERVLPPEEASSDFGLCIKVWDFGLRPGQV